MIAIIQSLREYIGTPDFYVGDTVNYSALLEYFFAGVLLCIVVSFVFKAIITILKGLF